MPIYRHPKSLERSQIFQVRLNGQPVDVLHTDVVDFTILSLEESDFPANIEVIAAPLHKVPSAALHPLSKNISARISGDVIAFTLDKPEKLSLVIPSLKSLYIFANPPENNPPSKDDPSVITIPSGQIHESPMLTLEDGQTLYIPGGAVLKARIHVKGKSGIRICGHGVFDGSFYQRAQDGSIQSIILERCRDVMVEDITMVRPAGWMLMLAACMGATVRNLKQIGEVVSSDGIDIVGTSNVLIEDCFLHNNDDCVVVKAFVVGANNHFSTSVDGRENVENVLVRNCTFANWSAGNCMEIGHELSVDYVRNITFSNIDVLHVHGSGAVFSLHNNDRATVENIVFEDIRIEHCYDKLIDFRVSRSRYSTDEERGHIRGVTLRRIHWHRSTFNPGYTVSLIGGWDADHTVDDITIQDFHIDGKPVNHLDELEITTRHCHNLRLLPSS